MIVTKFDVYVGVSFGAFVAAGFANRICSREMHGGFAQRLLRMPQLIQAAAFAYFQTTSARGMHALTEAAERVATRSDNG